MSWQPLLDGVPKDRALECVRAIVDDLGRSGQPLADPSLAGGAAGVALLHAYLAETERGQESRNAAPRYVKDAAASVAEKPMLPSLYSGLIGVGWAMAHLEGRLSGLDAEDDVAEIDEVLWQHLEQSPWPDDYDLISGLVGFGVYALERLAKNPVSERESGSTTAVACLERVIDRLAETAEHRNEGVTWWTNPKWLPSPTREQFPEGYYNLGLAHGVPGVIALLGLVCSRGIECGRVRSLLEGAVSWLLAQRQPGGFPAWVSAGDTAMEPSRLAWCYGDPGVAAALLVAARCIQEPAWERASLAIARRASRRPPDQAGVKDAGLCHGAAGLGHIFNRMYQATGETWLADAARFWFERTLAMQRPGRGIGGYEAWLPDEKGETAWVADPGFLTGAAGVALALLAATTAGEPNWDRMLLTAIPPQVN
jgi:lantibiotic modifying enzyme